MVDTLHAMAILFAQKAFYSQTLVMLADTSGKMRPVRLATGLMWGWRAMYAKTPANCW
jgi:hypothetical protein